MTPERPAPQRATSERSHRTGPTISKLRSDAGDHQERNRTPFAISDCRALPCRIESRDHTGKVKSSKTGFWHSRGVERAIKAYQELSAAASGDRVGRT